MICARNIEKPRTHKHPGARSGIRSVAFHDLRVLVIVGNIYENIADVATELFAEAVEMLENKFADQVDITYIRGDQPIYYYIFSVE